MADDSDRIAAQVDAVVATAGIARSLKAMAAIDRETLLLYAWADLTYEGIAVAMDVPVGTVRSRLNRARRTLRTRLNLRPAGNVGTRTQQPSQPEQRPLGPRLRPQWSIPPRKQARIRSA